MIRALADKHPNTIRRDTEIFISQNGYLAKEYASSDEAKKRTAEPANSIDWET
jgi:hypothetical protein